MSRKQIVIISSVGAFIVFLFFGIFYYQLTRFNPNVAIDGIKVGGLTVNQALDKLESAESKNMVYLGDKLIFDGENAKTGFTDKDRPAVEKVLKAQRTYFPSMKAKNYGVAPSGKVPYKSETMKAEVKAKLLSINKGLTAPKDAEVQLVDGQMIITPSQNGNQFDVAGLIKEYESQEFESVIHLVPLIKKPLQADSPIIGKEKTALQNFLKQSVDYKVQGKAYSFIASELIDKASVAKDLKVQYALDINNVKSQLDEINKTQSTLKKNYTFKTHAGKVLSLKGQSYGWAIDVPAEAKRIQAALKKGTKSILAYNVYGIGWNVNGVGYHTTTNHGIGNTYVEVSIEKQRIWVYKNGKLMVTTPVVTGTHIYHEDTPKGVWYIEYKESPSVLKGSEVGNPNYEVKVQYWAPFTLTGDGFHDASWRRNWRSDAYIKYGSGGCVNVPPSVMKKVYDNIVQYEPVVIY